MRSEPALVGPDDSLSLPIPGSVPMPVPMSGEGMLGVSAGRATGRPPSGLAPLARELLVGRDAAADGFEAALRLEPPLRLLLRLALLRPLLLVFAGARFAAAFFLPPERAAVERFAVVRRAVDLRAVDFLAVDRLAVDFFVDFFFAAMNPPFDARCLTAQMIWWRMIARLRWDL